MVAPSKPWHGPAALVAVPFSYSPATRSPLLSSQLQGLLSPCHP